MRTIYAASGPAINRRIRSKGPASGPGPGSVALTIPAHVTRLETSDAGPLYSVRVSAPCRHQPLVTIMRTVAITLAVALLLGVCIWLTTRDSTFPPGRDRAERDVPAVVVPKHGSASFPNQALAVCVQNAVQESGMSEAYRRLAAKVKASEATYRPPPDQTP